MVLPQIIFGFNLSQLFSFANDIGFFFQFA